MIYFLPVIISSGPVINELITQGASGSSFIESYGVITMIEQNLPSFLAEPISEMFQQIIVIFWFSGVQILIFLAGLQKSILQFMRLVLLMEQDLGKSFGK